MESGLIYRNVSVAFFGIVCISILGFFVYQKYAVTTVSYSGLAESDPQLYTVESNIQVTDAVRNSDTIQFVQRKLTGGGDNPGWVISLLETQPNVFTGRVIVDDGVYQFPVTLHEEGTNIFIGSLKGKTGKADVFSMKKIEQLCTDQEGNTFEYSITGTYGATQFSGCGGEVTKIASN